jgi:GT2 family glycosyltransferase
MLNASIVFLSYQHAAFVRQALVAAFDQTYLRLEIIIVDDGSTDSSRDIIQQTIRDHPRGAVARLLPAAPNAGITSSWNRAVAAASGDIIIGMASDDISRPDRVAKVAAYFEGDPQLMAVFSQVSLIDEAGVVFRERFVNRTAFSKNIGRGDVAGMKFWQGALILGASGCYRASLARQLPPLAEALSEDNPYVYRALLLGAVAYLPDSLVCWRWHGRNASLGSLQDESIPLKVLQHRAGLYRGQAIACRQFLADAETAFARGLIDEVRLTQERKKIAALQAIEELGYYTIMPGTRLGEWLSAAWTMLRHNWKSPSAWRWLYIKGKIFLGPVGYKLARSRVSHG